jgi:hypothetical protein
MDKPFPVGIFGQVRWKVSTICKAGCRDLVEDDIDEGNSTPLPPLSDEQWSLLLDAPPFNMATCMKYTRTRKVSSRNSSGRSLDQRAPAVVTVKQGTALGSSSRGSDNDSGESDVGDDDGPEDNADEGDDEDDTEEAADEGGAQDKEGVATEWTSMQSSKVATLQDAQTGLHFVKESICEVETMPEQLRVEVGSPAHM